MDELDYLAIAVRNKMGSTDDVRIATADASPGPYFWPRKSSDVVYCVPRDPHRAVPSPIGVSVVLALERMA